MNRQEWETKVCRELEELADVSTSDAQAIMEAKGSMVNRFFDNGETPEETARRVNIASLSIDKISYVGPGIINNIEEDLKEEIMDAVRDSIDVDTGEVDFGILDGLLSIVLSKN